MIVSSLNMEYNKSLTMAGDTAGSRPYLAVNPYPDAGMYERFFFLKEKPFHITPDPRFLYLSRKHREAIDLLTFGINGRKGFILLTGEVGTGKTTLCRALLEKLPPGTESALILNPVLSDVELLKTITQDLSLKVAEDTPKGHIDALNSFLLELSASGGNAVVIIDEAQNLSPAALEMVRLLSNLETEKEKLLQIILVGQPELKEKLSRTNLRQLNQRIIIRHHLEPLDLGETGAYIENRLAIAGGNGVEFTKDALRSIHKGSGGIPRMINIICDRALTAAFIDGKKAVDSSVLGKALVELRREGYIQDGADGSAGPYLHYTPHIALSAFVLSFIAGILWGAELLKIAAGY